MIDKEQYNNLHRVLKKLDNELTTIKLTATHDHEIQLKKRLARAHDEIIDLKRISQARGGYVLV